MFACLAVTSLVFLFLLVASAIFMDEESLLVFAIALLVIQIMIASAFLL